MHMCAIKTCTIQDIDFVSPSFQARYIATLRRPNMAPVLRNCHEVQYKSYQIVSVADASIGPKSIKARVPGQCWWKQTNPIKARQRVDLSTTSMLILYPKNML